MINAEIEFFYGEDVQRKGYHKNIEWVEFYAPTPISNPTIAFYKYESQEKAIQTNQGYEYTVFVSGKVAVAEARYHYHMNDDFFRDIFHVEDTQSFKTNDYDLALNFIQKVLRDLPEYRRDMIFL